MSKKQTIDEHKEEIDPLFIPLEENFSKIFGKFDSQQERLLELNAAPLVLMENASGIFAVIKELPKFLESIIDLIIDSKKLDYVNLGSYTIPYVLKNPDPTDPEIEHVYKEDSKRSKEYDYVIQKIKGVFEKKMQKSQDFIVHVGALFKNETGHYGVLFKDEKEIMVYDSMQYDAWSHYTEFFIQVARDIWPETEIALSRYPPNEETCHQFTGGFIIDENDDTIQDLDSQNHFCYMWAIWYFHAFFMPKEMDTFIDKKVDTLSVIKRYIWAILHLSEYNLKNLIKKSFKKMKKKDTDFLYEFFTIHFRYIWKDKKAVEIIKKKDTEFKNINECFIYSIT